MRELPAVFRYPVASEITDFISIVGIVLPVCAGLLLFGVALLGARVYAEFKS
jgi:hypothetical protein